MAVIRTPRLSLRELTPGDAGFIVTLLNDPAFLEHIGDKGVRTDADARRYVLDGGAGDHARFGFGMWRVTKRRGRTPMGVCGLLQRDYLPLPDLGFAYLPQYRRRGYACESARGVIAFARDELGLAALAAMVSPGNAASIGLLRKLGFEADGTLRPPGAAADVELFRLEL